MDVPPQSLSMRFSMSVSPRAFGHALVVFVVLVGFCALSSAAEIFSENFAEGYKRGPLVGQQGWQQAVEPSSPVVFDTEGLYGHDGWAVTSGKSGGANDFAMKVIPNPGLTGKEKIVVEITASLGRDSKAGRSITVSFGSKPMEKGLGLSFLPTGHIGAFFRDGWARTDTADDPSNLVPMALQNGDTFVLRSIWNLADHTVSLAVKNLTSGEQQFRPVLFSGADKRATADLGDASTFPDWDKICLRFTGTKGVRLYTVQIFTE